MRRLRRLLGAEAVATRGSGYALEVDPDRVDALRFGRLLDQAAVAPDPVTRRDRLDGALELWRGTPFDGVRSDWLERTQTAPLQERYLAARERRVDLDLADGSATDLIAELSELARRHPLREPLWVRLLVALERAGRPAEALQRYEEIRTRLADELGTDPGSELRQLHADLLAGRRPRSPTGVESVAPRVVPRQLPAGTIGFVGRAAALKALDGLLGAADDPAPRHVVRTAIVGTAGIGKTMLAIHWAHLVAHRFPDGQLYADLRGYDPSGSPVEPGEAIGGFLDALGVPPQDVPASLDTQAGLYRSMLAGRRMLVLLDNARDAEQVAPLMPGAPGCLAIVTSRHQLPGLVANGAHLITLDLLDPDEAGELLAHRLSHDRIAAEPGPTGELIARCAGLPLALAIVAARAITRPELPLAALAASFAEAPDAGMVADGLGEFDAGDIATNARAVFSWSYGSLDEPAARLFRLLGLHAGPDISVAAVASLAGLPIARVRRPLADLTRAHLLIEPVPGRYACHDLLRAYASELAHRRDPESDRLAATHRLLDHYVHTAHAADRLLYQCGETIPVPPVGPGVTVERPDDPDRAEAWFATEYGVLVATVRHASRTGFHRHASHLAWALSLFQHRRGHWRDRADLLRLALDAAERDGDGSAQVRAHRYVAASHADLGRFDDAQRHFDAALELAVAADDVSGQAHAQYERSLAYGIEGRTADALDATREARRLFEATGDPVGRATALTDAGWYLGRLGDHRRGLTLLRQALTLHRRLENHAYLAHTWSCMGESHGRLGDTAQAVACYRQALDLFVRVGDRYGQASTLAHLAATHTTAGDIGAAVDARRRSEEILEALDPPVAAQLRSLLRIG